MSHDAHAEIAKAGFPGPDRFVMETETPGGSCVNCHSNLETGRGNKRLHIGQRLENPTCVHACVHAPVCVK